MSDIGEVLGTQRGAQGLKGFVPADLHSCFVAARGFLRPDLHRCFVDARGFVRTDIYGCFVVARGCFVGP